MLLLGLLDAVKEEVLDLCFFRVVKCIGSLELLILSFLGQHLLLQNQYIKVSRGIIGSEELNDLIHDLCLGGFVLQEQILDVLLDLVVARVNTEVLKLLLCLGQSLHSVDDFTVLVDFLSGHRILIRNWVVLDNIQVSQYKLVVVLLIHFVDVHGGFIVV